MAKLSNSLIVKSALSEDISSPYIWFYDLPCASREIVKVSNKNNHKSIWCEVIKASSNYIERYNRNERTFDIYENEPFLVANAWYRAKLGLKKNESFNIEVKYNSLIPGFIRQLFASYIHPDNSVRLAVDLAFVSVGLGVSGLILGFISLI